LPVEVIVVLPALLNVMKPVPTIWNVFGIESVRPPMSNVQLPVVTSMLSPIVTDVAVQGPLGGAQRTLAVLATGSGPQLCDVAAARPGRISTAMKGTSARRSFDEGHGRIGTSLHADHAGAVGEGAITRPPGIGVNIGCAEFFTPNRAGLISLDRRHRLVPRIVQFTTPQGLWTCMMRAILALFGVLSFATGADAVLVTSCGQQIPARDVGYLQNDLVCDGPFATTALTLGRNASLRMNGHTIAVTHPDGGIGIVCPGSCAVVGPGTIHGIGNGDYGTALLSDRGKLAMSDVEVFGFQRGVTKFPRGTMIATNLLVHDCSSAGIAAGKLRADQVTVHQNGIGISTTSGVKGTGVTATENATHGIQAARRVRIVGADASENAEGGIVAQKITLTSATVVGNGSFDIGSSSYPQLTDTVCDHSLVFPGGGSWGVCSLD